MTANPTIEFVYFDLGNVLLYFDHDRACQNIGRRLGCDAADVRRALFDTSLQIQYETGAIGDEEFCESLFAELGARCRAEDLLRDASDIFRPNMDLVPVVQRLEQRGVRLGILSNTCSAHWQFVLSERYEAIPSSFQETVLSFESRAMKPDRKIYEDAIERAAVPAEQIFFMDDRTENVTAAVNCGIDAVTFQSARQLQGQLTDRGLFAL